MTSLQPSAQRHPYIASSALPDKAAAIAQVIGIACIAGFIIDIAVLALPLDLRNLDWRLGMFQQIGDRSIILLFGTALLILANLSVSQLRKAIAFIALSIGVFFLLTAILAVRDGVSANKVTLENINRQASSLQAQLEEAQQQTNLAPELATERMQQAEQQLQRQSEALQQQAKISVLKGSISSVGNLLVSGIGLVFLGRLGARSGRSF